MKHKNKYSISLYSFFILALIINQGCKEEPKLKFHKHYDFNILLVPDLSNRINSEIHPKPIEDSVLINFIVENSENLLKTNNRTTNVLDIYKFDFINRGILNEGIVNSKDVEINFAQFKDKLVEASKYRRENLKTDISNFKLNVSEIYNYSLNNPSGSDVWNYFNETINQNISKLKIDTIPLQTNNIKLIRKTRNIVVLFTDGYIENSNNKNGYQINQELINFIRDRFNESGSQDLEKFILSKPEFFLKKTENDLSNIEVLIVEIADRSLNKNGVAQKHPTDFQIMKILWQKWLNDSGCTKIQIHQAFDKKNEAFETLKTFLEDKKL